MVEIELVSICGLENKLMNISGKRLIKNQRENLTNLNKGIWDNN